MTDFLAHSAGRNPPVPPQSYSLHIANVLARAEENISHLDGYYKGDFLFFRETVREAATFHDLGKLDEANQQALVDNRKRKLDFNHVDAGTAFLVKNNWVESALMVYSHHIGLQSIPDENAKGEFFLRDPETYERTELYLTEYLNRHSKTFNSAALDPPKISDWNGLTRRIALSCLVDADHGDTAANYQREFRVQTADCHWHERLEKLNHYVKGLQQASTQNKRNKLRQEIYEACLEADTTPQMYACDSPVGTGKTTAIMAHLLKSAIAKNLRHIIVVLPYTNIIKQSVDIYRKALVLPGEKEDEVVAEHHHQVDFKDIETRQLSTLWKAPIIVTTAVQFFETIASNHPSKLRKLHELPGSAIFVDETHAAIPTALWPQTWKWIKDLKENWKCHFVFASGSLPHFWELRDLMQFPEKLPNLIRDELREKANRLERQRIVPIRHPAILDIEGLLQLVLNTPGPRLIIMNTVQSAAVIADQIAKKLLGRALYHDQVNIDVSPILHLSTALAPIDREKIVTTVEQRLHDLENNKDFTLVATSCVEAGVDFSFRSAFRERAGIANLIQTGGRVRRHDENFEAKLVDFKISHPLINRNPSFDLSSQVLERLFEEGKVSSTPPAALVTEAMRRELMSNTTRTHQTIVRKEADMDYPHVAKEYRVIADNSVLVLIDQELKLNLQKGDKVDPREINKKSVRIWSNKRVKTLATEIQGFPGLFAWPDDAYDKFFLGYMKGILPLLQIDSVGYGIIS